MVRRPECALVFLGRVRAVRYLGPDEAEDDDGFTEAGDDKVAKGASILQTLDVVGDQVDDLAGGGGVADGEARDLVVDSGDHGDARSHADKHVLQHKVLRRERRYGAAQDQAHRVQVHLRI